MLSIVESVDWWDWCTQRPLSTPSVSTGEVKVLSLSSSTPITYSQLLYLTGATERRMSTINGALSFRIKQCGTPRSVYLKWDSRCIIFQHPQNSAHVISVEECLEDKQFLLPFRRSLFLRICFKMTQSAHSAAPSQDSQNWCGRNSPILQQSQECMSEVRCSLVFTLLVWDKTRPISYFLPRRQQLASFYSRCMLRLLLMCQKWIPLGKIHKLTLHFVFVMFGFFQNATQ